MTKDEAKYWARYEEDVKTESTKDLLSNCNAITFFPPATGDSPYIINSVIVMTEFDAPMTYSAAHPEELIVQTFSLVFSDILLNTRAVIARKQIDINPKYKVK